MLKHLIMALALASLVGCGAPQYAKDYWKIDPSDGTLIHWSAQTVSLKIGRIDAGIDPNGTKWMKIGEDGGFAIEYGADPTSAMTVYVAQQAEYTKMLDVVGKNLIGQIEALGNAGGQILGGLAGLRSAASAIGGPTGAALCGSVDSMTAQVQDLMTKASAMKTILSQLQALQSASPGLR